MIRTLLVLIPVISVYTIVLGTISVASTLVDRSGRFAHGCARLWSKLILWTSGVRVRMHGLERLDPTGRYVFVSNHQSTYDIPILFASLPYQVRIIAKEALGPFPFIGWHLRRSGHIVVERRNPIRAGRVVQRAAALVQAGRSLVVFPEGTRSRDGSIGRFKPGSFVVAVECGAPIVPLTITGSRKVMEPGRLPVYRGTVDVFVGAAIDTGGRTRHDARALAERVREVVVEQAPAAFPESRGSQAAHPPGLNEEC